MEKVGSAAASGASLGAKAAGRGFVHISVYVQTNPSCLCVFCFILGLLVSACAIITMVDTCLSESYSTGQAAHDFVQSIFMFFFGVIICVCDSKHEYVDRFFQVQTRLFTFMHFLASNAGRACFYFYVGTILIFRLPENSTLTACNITLGVLLSFSGVVMLFIRYCTARAPGPTLPENGGQLPVI
mmetsp:Transcript_36598/g.97596  ORF Transcript_36598/g.97596 Transcript_36598/m.97596 type:complete len:185 (-) Transcript_36598:271-825(-)